MDLQYSISLSSNTVDNHPIGIPCTSKECIIIKSNESKKKIGWIEVFLCWKVTKVSSKSFSPSIYIPSQKIQPIKRKVKLTSTPVTVILYTFLLFRLIQNFFPIFKNVCFMLGKDSIIDLSFPPLFSKQTNTFWLTLAHLRTTPGFHWKFSLVIYRNKTWRYNYKSVNIGILIEMRKETANEGLGKWLKKKCV